MFRCLKAAQAIAAACAFAASFAATAQTPLRHFPADALRGELVIGAAPEANLNGQAARLGAGARVRGLDNLVKMPAALAGQKLVVNYTLDTQGLLRDVWILTEAEAAKKPWPKTRQEAASWQFDAVSQTWVKP